MFNHYAVTAVYADGRGQSTSYFQSHENGMAEKQFDSFKADPDYKRVVLRGSSVGQNGPWVDLRDTKKRV